MLLKPGGFLAMMLRSGAAETERGIYSVSPDEVERLVRAHGAFVDRIETSPGRLARGT